MWQIKETFKLGWLEFQLALIKKQYYWVLLFEVTM